MRRTTTQRSGMRRRAGETSGSGAVAVDHLSALPDALLHHIMSFLKAWEVVRTCVLAHRWRHLWASAPCIDLRVSHSGSEDDPPEEFCDFMDSLFLLRDVSAPVNAGFREEDANTWIRTAISRNARVIHLAGHQKGVALLDRVHFISCHLKILKLSHARLEDRILGQLSSSCKSLEELDLKDCLFTGPEIVSASLKILIMLKCTFNWDFSIAAPNLVLLHLITPSVRVPSFKNLGSLVTGTIILDDSLLSDDFGHISDDDDFDETTDDEDEDEDEEEEEDDDDDDVDVVVDDDNDKSKSYKVGYGYGLPPKKHGLRGYKDKYGYGSDIESDDNTCEYSEIADGYLADGQNFNKEGNYHDNGGSYECNGSKILGGCNILQSLSSATSLELLTDAGEKFNSKKTWKTGIELKERSFTCKHVRIVKIKAQRMM